jgi:stage II sporulation protein D
MARRALVTIFLASAYLALALAPLSASAGSRRADRRTKLVWTPATLVFTGHGWGHGVGLSQYGAFGYAQHGFTHDKIVTHYFRGTELDTVGSKIVGVLLASGRSSLTISSSAPFSVTDADGNYYDLANLSVTLDSSLKVNADNGEGQVALSGPIDFSAGSAALAYGGRQYRGKLRVSVVGGKVRLVNRVGLEPYLYGVVPCESPHDWPAEALEAQAVVSRSYALASLRSGSDFDVYADTRSQVYLGISGEYPESNAAVKATAGEALFYKGKVARTYFFSTSGGRTAAIQDAWPNAEPVPYLVSVKDPYDKASPYHNWGPIKMSSRKLARTLHIRGPVSNVKTTRNRSRRVTTMTVTGAGGKTYSFSGYDVKMTLGLRSNWFKVTVLSLQHPRGRVARGAKLRIAGVARAARSPVLQTRLPGSAWKKVRKVSPRSAGVFKVTLRPKRSAYYRLSSKEATGPTVRIAVR